MRVTNVSITDRAAVALKAELAKFKAGRGDVLALVYMSSFVERDGRTVDGFRAGYAAMPWPASHLGATWLMAQPVDGPDFYFAPRFGWSPGEQYVVDLAGGTHAIFSIEPAGISPA